MKIYEADHLQTQSLNALFEYATEGIIITNGKGVISRANPSSERLFGYERGSLRGRVIEDLVPRRFSESHKHSRALFLEQPHARAMGKGITLYGRRRDDSEFPVEISLSFFQQDGETMVIAFIIDITERKRQEENIIRLNQELERKVEERTKVLQEALIEIENSRQQLSLALESQKELNDMKSRFVTMASHEFRTPLSTVLSSTSLINKYNEGQNAEKINKHVQRIKSAVTNMTLILNDFLSAEKLEEGKVNLRKEDVDLQLLAQEVLNDIQGILKNGQQVDYSHQGETIAHLDKLMTRNIFLNLVSNAIKFSGEDSVIVLRTEISPDEVYISVADQGIGIPEEEQVHLFERFFRARNVTNIQGTGLGLNIVAKYLESMKGSIDFKSVLNKGTVFEVRIPREQQVFLESGNHQFNHTIP